MSTFSLHSYYTVLSRLPEHPKSPYLASRAPVPRQRPGYRDPYYTEPYVVSTTTRTDKIQQLREEHQRRHQERQGRYPLDEQEEMYERHLQEMERRVRHIFLECFLFFFI